LIWLNHAEYQKRIPPKGIHSVDLWVSQALPDGQIVYRNVKKYSRKTEN